MFTSHSITRYQLFVLYWSIYRFLMLMYQNMLQEENPILHKPKFSISFGCLLEFSLGDKRWVFPGHHSYAVLVLTRILTWSVNECKSRFRVIVTHQTGAAGLAAHWRGHRTHGADWGGAWAAFQTCRCGHLPRCSLCFGWSSGREANACHLVHWGKKTVLRLTLEVPGNHNRIILTLYLCLDICIQ